MKKVLFLMLFLLVLGVAGVKAQVRIGGNTAPNAAAVLDLNATDDATPAANKGALALPRVSLASTTAQLNGTTPITGMLVYNTNPTLGVGVYFWDGGKWVLISGNGVVGNALMDTIANGGLNKTGAGTAVSPYKVGIRTGGITNDMIANQAVTLNKIYTAPTDSGYMLQSNGSKWVLWDGGKAEVFNTTLLTTITPVPVTWSIILATTLTFSAAPNTVTTFAAPGVSDGDLCIVGQNAPTLIAIAGQNKVHVVTFTIGIPLIGRGLTCYRAGI